MMSVTFNDHPVSKLNRNIGGPQNGVLSICAHY